MRKQNAIEILEPILVEYKEKEQDIAQAAVLQGKIPNEMCQMCQHRSWLLLPSLITLSDSDSEKFINFAREMGVFRLYKNHFQNDISEIFHDISGTFQGIKNDGTFCEISKSDLKTHKLNPELLENILEECNHGLQICHHLVESKNKNSDEEIHVTFIESEYKFLSFRSQELLLGFLNRKERGRILFLCCDKCFGIIKKRGCRRISENGFLFNDHECVWRENLLKFMLNQYSIDFKTMNTFFPQVTQFFIPEIKTLILMGYFSRPKELVQKLKPDLVILFGERRRMFEFLGMNVSVMVVEEGQIYFYDNDRPLETSLNAIIEEIITNLRAYTEEARGNDHDRIVAAFTRIGEKLGYVTDTECHKNRTLVDSVWFDAKGLVSVATEVETSGQWKKDIVSTWELEPQLAIILTTYHKTEQIAETLSKNILMKYLPHPLLYINMKTGYSYLFEKQSIKKTYILQKMD